MAGKGSSYPRPDWRPVTKFECRAIESGHKINDFIFKKIK
ncbi:putative tRNA (guanine-N(7)-)-methyltransferase [Acinetobacter baumannii 541915]|nr:putative tRNA (guanine-N(7)-)-methyltransferase [Acinetobacter baumannii 541915]